MFPGYIRSLDDAVAHLDDWARAMGGQRINGITTEDTRRGATAIRPFNIEFAGGRVLTVSMTVLADLAPVTYRFNLTTGGVLTWRLDLHQGHEAEHGGPSHLHIGPTQSYRIAHRPVALVDVADRVHRTFRERPKTLRPGSDS